jgi:hypothetical protein
MGGIRGDVEDAREVKGEPIASSVPPATNRLHRPVRLSSARAPLADRRRCHGHIPAQEEIVHATLDLIHQRFTFCWTFWRGPAVN